MNDKPVGLWAESARIVKDLKHRRADAAMARAKLAMSEAAAATIARQANATKLAEHALELLRKADQARSGALGKPGGDDAST